MKGLPALIAAVAVLTLVVVWVQLVSAYDPAKPAQDAGKVEAESALKPPALFKPSSTKDDFSPAELALMKQIYAAFATGDFSGALKLADKSLDDAAGSPAFLAWLRTQMPALLTSSGWSHLRLGRCDESIQEFGRANALKKDKDTIKGLAICFYKQKNMRAAREPFQTYLLATPGDQQMQLLYSDVLESEGRFSEAVTILEQILASPPAPQTTAGSATVALDKDALQQRLASMRGREDEGGLEQSESSRNFHLTYRVSEHDDVVAFALSTLEDALDQYVLQYGMAAPSSQIEVVLYPDSVFKSVVTYGPSWAEGLFDGRLRIPVPSQTLRTEDYANLEIVLRHELVHALLSLQNDGRSLPPWFDEGLAQKLSCAGQSCAGFSFDPQPGGFLSKDSFQTPYLSLSALNAGRAYKQSLYLVTILESDYGDNALRQVISHLTTTSTINSDGLLSPLKVDFNSLHARASASWQARRIPGR